MTANVNLSYSYQNQIRDLVPTFTAMVASAPILLSLIPVAPYFAKNHTHEWLDDKLSPKQTALTAASLAALAGCLFFGDIEIIGESRFSRIILLSGVNGGGAVSKFCRCLLPILFL